MIKTMRLVRKPEPKQPRRLDVNAAHASYQSQYDQMTSKYQVRDTRKSWLKVALKWLKGIK